MSWNVQVACACGCIGPTCMHACVSACLFVFHACAYACVCECMCRPYNNLSFIGTIGAPLNMSEYN